MSQKRRKFSGDFKLAAVKKVVEQGLFSPNSSDSSDRPSLPAGQMRKNDRLHGQEAKKEAVFCEGQSRNTAFLLVGVTGIEPALLLGTRS